MPGIPDADAAIGATSDQLRSAEFSSLTTNTINNVTHGRVSLHFELRDSLLDIENVELTFVINSRHISDRNRRCFEGSTLNSELLVPLRKKDELTLVHGVNIEDSISPRGLTEQAESSGSRDPLDIEGGEGQGLLGVDEHLRGVRGLHLFAGIFKI